MFVTKAVLAGVLALGVGAGGVAYMNSRADSDVAAVATLPLTIKSANGTHAFKVESAKTEAEQARGLMFRTDLKPDGGMLFWPYPAKGGEPVVANFWMKNTPSPLDILYIRADGTIAKEIMPDFLHLTPKGYEIWAKAIEPTLSKLMGE